MLSIWNLSARGRTKTGRRPAPAQLAEVLPLADGAVEAVLEGHVDRIEGNRVIGWAWDPSSPNRPVVVEVTVGTQQKLALASLERADVRATGRGDGHYGYEAVLDREAAPGDTIHVRFFATQRDLIGSPIVMNVESLLRHPSKQAILDRIGFEAQAAAFELETLAEPAAAPETPAADPYPTRADLDTLLSTAAPDADPEGLISRYLEYEIYRFKLEETFFLRGTLTERMRILHWYLSDYGPRRGLQLPLSRQQIAFLNTPVPVIGLHCEMSVAAYGFIMQEYGQIRPNDGDHLRECLYWWCVERSDRIAPGGELITADQVRQVTFASPIEAGLKFSLNYFSRRYHELDTSLHCFDLHNWLDRAAYACCLLLCCVKRPTLSRFLPRIALAELLAEMQGGATSNLDAILRLALKADRSNEVGTMTVDEFRDLLETHLHNQGFSIRKAGTGEASASHSALALRPNRLVSAGLDRGVAVIGPTQATSGLGQATRLSIDVMREAGRKPAIFDFNLDNPAPRGFGSEVDPTYLRTPRQINLLHLNAEAIPLAVAYLPNSIYAKSYNIGYFFWELDKIPKCHRLALDVLDEIWVSSEYNREIYSRYTDLPVHNVGMAVEPLPEAEPVARSEFGIVPDAFVFLSTFDSYSFVERKNPLGTIAAFRRAFPVEDRENVVLILKTQNRTKVFDPHQIRVWQQIDRMASEDPRIRVVDQTLSYRHLLGFKGACDAYVSLHRSEGWGFGMIEAMQLRLPVITTAYSGNMEFCSPETACLVDYELVQPTPAEYIFVERGSRWAEPSIEAAAAGLRAVFENPAAAKARADAAFRNVRDNFSTSAIAGRYERRLSEIDAIIRT